MSSVINLTNPEMQMLAGIMTKVDWPAFATALRKAKGNPTKKHYAVLFDYVYSCVHEPIAMIEKVKGMSVSVHDAIQHPKIDEWLMNTFCTGNCQIYTRRKMDFTKTGMEQITHIRQLLVVFEPYAFHPMGAPCPQPLAEDE
jgi:hypothetical protein